jgi:transcriptional regulator with XRE-family HTH domain
MAFSTRKTSVKTKPAVKAKERRSKASDGGHRTVVTRQGQRLALREKLGMTRETFAGMLPVSTRSLADIESGKQPPGDATARRLTELQRLTDALGEVLNPAAIGDWLKTPNDAFEGLKPLEVIHRGESDRLWRMIFLLRSGTPG